MRANTVGGMPQTYTTHITNTYTNGMLSQQVGDTYKNGNDGDVADSRQTYSYTWWDGALQHSIGNDNDNGGAIDWTTDYAYDSSGHLITADIDDGRDRVVTFRSDQNGMIVERDEADLISTKGDPRSLNYFFAGMQMGQVGNEGTAESAPGRYGRGPPASARTRIRSAARLISCQPEAVTDA